MFTSGGYRPLRMLGNMFEHEIPTSQMQDNTCTDLKGSKSRRSMLPVLWKEGYQAKNNVIFDLHEFLGPVVRN